MKKKITAMLLAICCISSTWTVYADDFSSGSSEVEIEITEDEDEDADDVEITEDADADDEMFSDGTESSTSGGDISAMANQIVARAEIQAQEYQQLKKEAKKYADAQEVARRAQEKKKSVWRNARQLRILQYSLLAIHMYGAEQASRTVQTALDSYSRFINSMDTAFQE